VQPQQAATVCELDLVQQPSGHGNGLNLGSEPTAGELTMNP
jgi:hypothetical protein